VESVVVTAAFGAKSADLAGLPKSCLIALETLYHHPVAHNLDWSDVVALFTRIGTVEPGAHDSNTFGVGGERHHVAKPHGKDLTVDDVMALRRILTRAGWSPDQAPAQPGADGSAPATAETTDMLVVVEEAAARLYPLDQAVTDHKAQVIRPEDALLDRHLSGKDQGRDAEERGNEEAVFYGAIAKAVSQAARIVLIGHGKGHSNATQQFGDYLKKHHPLVFARVVSETSADLGALSDHKLLELGRRALTK
jgi:hypothetical protein